MSGVTAMYFNNLMDCVVVVRRENPKMARSSLEVNPRKVVGWCVLVLFNK